MNLEIEAAKVRIGRLKNWKMGKLVNGPLTTADNDVSLLIFTKIN